MTKEGLETLEDIKKMMKNWIKDYSRDITGDGNDIYLFKMLEEDISDFGVMHAVNRLLQTDHIEFEDAKEFDIFLGNKLKEFYEECVKKDEEK